MEQHPLYGKRKKKISKCPNPLFEKWLKELKEDAASKNIKTQYVYGKALKSLQKYPLQFNSGKDCKILEYFGDKLCKILDDKLQKHIAEYGTTDPIVSSSDDEAQNIIPAPHRKSRPTTKSVPPPPSISNNYPTISRLPNLPNNQRSSHSVSSIESEGEGIQPQKKRQRSGSAGGREYIPQYRSGPYALLVTLYRNRQSPASRGYMTKAELIDQAQGLADKSFSTAEPGCRYTAWSSMGTLIKKGLVIKESSPAKYTITDAGIELAHKLEAVQANNSVISPSRSPTNPTRSPPPVTSMISPSEKYIGTNSPVKQPPSSINSDFQFTYITDEGAEVKEKDQAAVLIDDEIGFGFLAKCKYMALLHSYKRYKLDTTRPMGDDVFVYLHNDDAPELASSGHPQTNTDLPFLQTADVHRDAQSLKMHVESTNSEVKSKKVSKKITKSSSNESFASKAPRLLPLMETFTIVSNSSKTSHSALISENSQSSVDSLTDSHISYKSVSSAEDLPDFILRPGEFDIVLCVDNQEFYGSRQGSGKSLLPELMKNGVNCDLRKLQVGDLVWVAQEKVLRIPGQLEKPKGRELVLDFIIERKRMDDLVSSCMDGRLADQKMRLKQCGLRRPIFMVENYGSMQHFSIQEERIQQTITNLKVIDGFQVKRTKDLKESVAYLTVMTRYIQSYYQNKTLYACSPEDLQDFAGAFSINDLEFKLQTFEHFSKGSVKSKNLKVREMFAKQLIQVCGLSGERAKAITETYPTLLHLLSAYDICQSQKDKESLLSTIKTNTRNLGMNPSKVLYQLYCNNAALT